MQSTTTKREGWMEKNNVSIFWRIGNHEHWVAFAGALHQQLLIFPDICN